MQEHSDIEAAPIGEVAGDIEAASGRQNFSTSLFVGENIFAIICPLFVTAILGLVLFGIICPLFDFI